MPADAIPIALSMYGGGLIGGRFDYRRAGMRGGAQAQSSIKIP
jgi:hypothetical protein